MLRKNRGVDFLVDARGAVALCNEVFRMYLRRNTGARSKRGSVAVAGGF